MNVISLVESHTREIKQKMHEIKQEEKKERTHKHLRAYKTTLGPCRNFRSPTQITAAVVIGKVGEEAKVYCIVLTSLVG